MNRFHWLLLVASLTVWSSTPTVAFDNIEADYVYGSAIKDQIREEFLLGLKMLKTQADGFGMEVRDKDVSALKKYMYEKAYLMGRCVDKAITSKKMNSDNSLLDKSVKDCIVTHIKFVAWLQSPKPKQFADLPDPNDDHLALATNAINDIDFPACLSHIFSWLDAPPFDFFDVNGILFNDEITYRMPIDTNDYMAMRDCYHTNWIKWYRQKHAIVPPEYLFDKLTSSLAVQSATPKQQSVNNRLTTKQHSTR